MNLPVSDTTIKPPRREFKGVWIPREVYLAADLSWTEKILLVEIDSLSQGDKGCFASNEYFGGFLGISAGQVANILTKLRKMGLIEDLGFDGRNRYLKTALDRTDLKAAFSKTLKQGSGKPEGSPQENLSTIYRENNTDNNPENVSPASPETGSETTPEKPLQRKTKFSLDPTADDDFGRPPKVSKPKLTTPDELAVLATYKRVVYGMATERTTSAVEGIKRALGVFYSEFDKEGAQKLIEALHALPTSQAYQWRLEKDPTAAAPKTVFSQQFIENYLLPLVTVKPYESGATRDMVKPATTEEERRRIAATNKANVDKFLGRA